MGVEVQKFFPNKLKYRGCLTFMSCKTKLDGCLLKDDSARVLDVIRGAIVFVMGSPIDFEEIPSQLKAFVDRTPYTLFRTFTSIFSSAVWLAVNSSL
jgi:multimeric flavodoxin WrbA